jgi:hypothetical protein
MRRYHFAVRAGGMDLIEYGWLILSDLGSVHAEARRVAQCAVDALGHSEPIWRRWRVEVRVDDGTVAFVYPLATMQLAQPEDALA